MLGFSGPERRLVIHKKRLFCEFIRGDFFGEEAGFY